MYLTMAILLGLVAAFIELRTAFSIPFVRGLIEKFSAIGIVFSITLSILIGGIFAAGGLVVMLGALIATTITQPVYMVAARVKRTGHDVAETVSQVRAVFRPFKRLFMLAFRIAVFPFRVLYAIIKFADRHTSKTRAATS